MATLSEINKWNSYLKKIEKMYKYGLESGLIGFYSKELIEKARHIYYGGVPTSLWLLSPKFSNGNCMNMTIILANILKDHDYQVVYAIIDGIALNPDYIDEDRDELADYFGMHCFLEVKDDNGRIVVIDTSQGLIFDKEYYYKIENPKVIKINSKITTENYIEYKEIENCDIEKTKYSSIPTIMAATIISKMYEERYTEIFKKEIEIVKQELNYEEMLKEEISNMEKMGLKVS